MDLSAREKLLIEEFSRFQSWEYKYKHIIRLGRDLESLPEDEKLEDLKVKGCQSQVWLKANLGDDGRVYFKADSDAMIVKGLVAILLKLYSGLKPSEILAASPAVLETLGLKDHLSPSRANGLFSMLKQIKFYGLAFQHLSLNSR